MQSTPDQVTSCNQAVLIGRSHLTYFEGSKLSTRNLAIITAFRCSSLWKWAMYVWHKLSLGGSSFICMGWETVAPHLYTLAEGTPLGSTTSLESLSYQVWSHTHTHLHTKHKPHTQTHNTHRLDPALTQTQHTQAHNHSIRTSMNKVSIIGADWRISEKNTSLYREEYKPTVAGSITALQSAHVTLSWNADWWWVKVRNKFYDVGTNSLTLLSGGG